MTENEVRKYNFRQNVVLRSGIFCMEIFDFSSWFYRQVRKQKMDERVYIGLGINSIQYPNGHQSHQHNHVQDEKRKPQLRLLKVVKCSSERMNDLPSLF